MCKVGSAGFLPCTCHVKLRTSQTNHKVFTWECWEVGGYTWKLKYYSKCHVLSSVGEEKTRCHKHDGSNQISKAEKRNRQGQKISILMLAAWKCCTSPPRPLRLLLLSNLHCFLLAYTLFRLFIHLYSKILHF